MTVSKSDINATNLTDGQVIKGLLESMVDGQQPATTTTAGTVKQAAHVALTAGGTDTVTATNLANVVAALVAAGLMAAS